MQASAMQIAGEVAKAMRDGIDADALHAGAIINLQWSDSGGASVDRSVDWLETLARITTARDGELADLSAALLVRAARDSSMVDLVRGAWVAGRAIDDDAQDEVALFNRAVALQGLGLTSQAIRAWDGYLATDSVSEWGKEARMHRQAAALGRVAARVPDIAASSTSWADYAARAPGDARIYAWEVLLKTWADSSQLGPPNGEQALDDAETIGHTLTRNNGDRTVEDAIKMIRSARTRYERQQLAAAHSRYARGQGLNRAARYLEADAEFKSILRTGVDSPALTQSAAVSEGVTLGYLRRYDEAERTVAGAIARVSPDRYPALLGRARWALGTMLLRRGQHDRGIASIRAAESLYERIGEEENLAAVEGIEGEALLKIGNDAAGFEALHRSLRHSSGFPGSVWRHGALLVFARALTDRGLDAMAKDIRAEDADVVERLGNPIYIAEARVEIAREVASAASPVLREAISRATIAISALSPSLARDQLQADLDLVHGHSLIRNEPARAKELLDSAVARFLPTQNVAKLIPAFTERATATLAGRGGESARPDLQAVVDMTVRRRDEIAALPERSAVMESVRNAAGQLVALDMAAGQPQTALVTLERTRTSFQRNRRNSQRPRPLLQRQVPSSI